MTKEEAKKRRDLFRAGLAQIKQMRANGADKEQIRFRLPWLLSVGIRAWNFPLSPFSSD